MKEKPDFVSAKLPRPMITWLKIEAARKGVPIYVVLTELCATGRDNKAPWQRGSTR